MCSEACGKVCVCVWAQTYTSSSDDTPWAPDRHLGVNLLNEISASLTRAPNLPPFTRRTGTTFDWRRGVSVCSHCLPAVDEHWLSCKGGAWVTTRAGPVGLLESTLPWRVLFVGLVEHFLPVWPDFGLLLFVWIIVLHHNSKEQFHFLSFSWSHFSGIANFIKPHYFITKICNYNWKGFQFQHNKSSMYWGGSTLPAMMEIVSF